MFRLLTISVTVIALSTAAAYGQGRSGLDNLGSSGAETLDRSSADYPGATATTPGDPSSPRTTDAPPGALCRVLLLDRPANAQPPIAPCEELESQVPPGGVLIRGTR